MLAFFEALSDESVYQRFHGFPSLGPELVEPFLVPDWTERGSLVGSLGGGRTRASSRSRATFAYGTRRRRRSRSRLPTSSRATA